MIGITCRILDSVLLEYKSIKLTHEVLCTLMAEVSAIINARQLVPVSSDSEMPLLPTPNILLTRETGFPLGIPTCNFSEKDIY